MREIDITSCGQLFQCLREQASSSLLLVTVNGVPVRTAQVSDGGNGLTVELTIVEPEPLTDKPSGLRDDLIPPASAGEPTE